MIWRGATVPVPGASIWKGEGRNDGKPRRGVGPNGRWEGGGERGGACVWRGFVNHHTLFFLPLTLLSRVSLKKSSLPSFSKACFSFRTQPPAALSWTFLGFLHLIKRPGSHFRAVCWAFCPQGFWEGRESVAHWLWRQEPMLWGSEEPAVPGGLIHSVHACWASVTMRRARSGAAGEEQRGRQLPSGAESSREYRRFYSIRGWIPGRHEQAELESKQGKA